MGMRHDGSELTCRTTTVWLHRLLCVAISALLVAAISAAAASDAPWGCALLAGVSALVPTTLTLVPRVAAMCRARGGGSGGGSGGLPEAASVALLSPEEIDCTALRRQLVTCDCVRVIEGLDMASRKAFSSEEVVGIDTLGALDALGGLSERATSGTAASAEAGAEDAPALTNADVHQLRLANCYMREFLSKPHPQLGRAGPVCPFVPKALKLSTMRVAMIHSGAGPAPAAMRELVRGFLPIFESLAPISGSTAVYKALLLLFPDVPLADAPRLIDGTQAALKEECVSRGLMLGEFHLANNATGLHSPTFYPLRTVCPTLAIRHMVPNDLVFLTGAQYPAEKRAAFLRSYVRKMAGAKGTKAQSDVAHAQQMLAELSAAGCWAGGEGVTCSGG